MNYRLLLVNPWIYDFTAYDLWSKPLGLLYISSFLRDFGFQIDFIDCLERPGNGAHKKYGTGHYERQIVEKPAILQHIPRHYARYGISEETFLEKLKKLDQPPDAVLVTSMMTYWYPGVRRAVELVRRKWPSCPVILGGIYATLMPDHAQRTIEPDFIIKGPGELQVLQVLSQILGFDMDPQKIPTTLDDYPHPAFDLLDNLHYLIIMTARGCPYNCSFCAQKRISMPFTQRRPQRVVDEIREHYKKFSLRDFAFYDDALFINRDKHIKVILDQVITSRLPVRFHSPNGLFARFIDRELAKLMHKSAFKTIRLSFETSNEARRKDMYSKVSNEDMIAAVDHLKSAGYKPKELEAYVLMGLPGQQLDEVVASMLFVHNLGVLVRLASFSPIPGTEEFDRAVERNQISADIDPLLTNKTIFPLKNEQFSYGMFRKLRTFSQILNEAARRDLLLFKDNEIGGAVRRMVNQIQ